MERMGSTSLDGFERIFHLEDVAVGAEDWGVYKC